MTLERPILRIQRLFHRAPSRVTAAGLGALSVVAAISQIVNDWGATAASLFLVSVAFAVSTVLLLAYRERVAQDETARRATDQELAAAREALEAAVTESSRLEFEVGLLRQSLAEARADDAESRTRLAGYMDTLSQAMSTRAARLDEAHEITFYVGNEREDDRVERLYKTAAAAGQPVLFRCFDVSVPDRDCSTFEDVDLQHFSDGRTTLFLPLRETESQLRGMVLFDPPIDGEAAPWSLGYRSPGAFDALRSRGRDEVTVVSRGESTLRVRIVLPRSDRKPEWKVSGDGESHEPIRRADGGWELVWQTSPGGRDLSYTFAITWRADELRAPRRRRASGDLASQSAAASSETSASGEREAAVR